MVFGMVSPIPLSLKCLHYVARIIHNVQKIYSFILTLDSFKDLHKYFKLSIPNAEAKASFGETHTFPLQSSFLHSKVYDLRLPCPLNFGSGFSLCCKIQTSQYFRHASTSVLQ